MKYVIDRSKLVEMEYASKRPEKAIVLYEDIYQGLRFVVLNIGTHPTAYVGIPDNHVLFSTPIIKHSKMEHDGKVFERDYDVTYDAFYFVDVHGGFTYSSNGRPDYVLCEGFLWLGWDYAHYGDYAGYTMDLPSHLQSKEDQRRWTTEEIIREAISVIDQILEADPDEIFGNLFEENVRAVMSHDKDDKWVDKKKST